MTVNDPILQRIARYSPQDVLLADVAVRVQLSPTQHLEATKHYEVMAEWIERQGSPLRGRMIEFYAQGGFSTGSTVAPHSERADFDLDAMAAIDWPHGIDPEQALSTLHEAIAGDRGSRYHDKAERKTRCTQVAYVDMHLDVTPSILAATRAPKTSFIFHSKPSDPTVKKERLWANPYGLAAWFNERTRAEEAFGVFFEGMSLRWDREMVVAKGETPPVPAQMPVYRKSRPLVCLQLIKRWRNVAYDRRHRARRLPPSVLLTYYVGENCGAERSLTDELIYQVECVIRTIEEAVAFGRLVHASNPTCGEDVLTDRWPATAQDQAIFLKELRHFARKLFEFKRGASLEEMRKLLGELFGERPAADAIASFRQRQVDDHNRGAGLYIPGRGSVPALGSFAAPATAKTMPPSTFFGD